MANYDVTDEVSLGEAVWPHGPAIRSPSRRAVTAGSWSKPDVLFSFLLVQRPLSPRSAGLAAWPIQLTEGWQ